MDELFLDNSFILIVYFIGICAIFGISAMIAEYFDWE